MQTGEIRPIRLSLPQQPAEHALLRAYAGRGCNPHGSQERYKAQRGFDIWAIYYRLQMTLKSQNLQVSASSHCTNGTAGSYSSDRAARTSASKEAA